MQKPETKASANDEQGRVGGRGWKKIGEDMKLRNGVNCWRRERAVRSDNLPG